MIVEIVLVPGQYLAWVLTGHSGHSIVQWQLAADFAFPWERDLGIHVGGFPDFGVVTVVSMRADGRIFGMQLGILMGGWPIIDARMIESMVLTPAAEIVGHLIPWQIHGGHFDEISIKRVGPAHW